jgi:hypothetical protein
VSYISGGGADDQLVTSDATLDVSHTKIYNFVVLSTNAIGTTFTVRDVATAFTIVGGPGQDTIVFTADQRNAIFTTASIEKIIDATGTYTASPVNAPTPPRGLGRPPRGPPPHWWPQKLTPLDPPRRIEFHRKGYVP